MITILSRLALTLICVFYSYFETGFATALCFLFIFIGLEAIGFILRVINRELIAIKELLDDR